MSDTRILNEILELLKGQFDNTHKEPFLDPKRITLPANGTKSFSTYCNSIRIKECTDANFEIAFNNGAFREISKGIEYNADGLIHDIRLRDTSGAENIITLYLSRGKTTDAGLVISEAIRVYQGGPIKDTYHELATPDVFEKVLDYSSTEHNFVTVQNKNSSGTITIGGADLSGAVHSALGIELTPGAVRDYAVRGDIYAKANASNLYVSIQYGD